MPILLAVETSGPFCSLAIHVAGRWVEDTQRVERQHNRVVLQNLDALTRRAGVHRRSFAAVAFGAGPGSFTGVRIATAVAQGIAFASNARVVPVASSHALAAEAQRRGTGSSGDIVTVTRSRRDAFYLAGYRIRPGGTPLRRVEDVLHQGCEPPVDLPDGIGVGDRPPWWPDGRVFIDDLFVHAETVGIIALERLKADGGVPPAEAYPVYVGGDSPWRPRGS